VSVRQRDVLWAWIPLALSWMLMAAELPALGAVVARLADPRIHLAAYGGVVFPLSLIIEAPVIMLLSASTALCKTQGSYRALWRYMMVMGGVLTALHVLIAFTPLFDLIATRVLNVPPEVVEPARIGMRIMTPWTWTIAYRRFMQGIQIRFGRSRLVGFGSAVRLASNLTVLLLGYFVWKGPGIIVGTSAIAIGVTLEALFAHFATRRIINGALREAGSTAADTAAVRLRAFLAFYIPLALTSLVVLAINPIGTAAVARMPRVLDSLAAWPSVVGLMFLFRCSGLALNEVVIATLERPRAYAAVGRFSRRLAAVITVVFFVVALTPLGRGWFTVVQNLTPAHARLGIVAILLGGALPGITVLQNWYQGQLVHARQTRAISEAILIFIVVCSGLLLFGIRWGGAPGIVVFMTASCVAAILQTLWLKYRASGLKRTKLVTAAVIRRGSSVLLTRRSPGEKVAGYWEFPGGKMQPGETPEVCLRRELLEELSLECSIGRKVAQSEYHYDHGAFTIVAYEAVIDSGTLALSVHDRAEWVDVDALLEYQLAPADIPIAEKIPPAFVPNGIPENTKTA
jgi:mutator protein MutT